MEASCETPPRRVTRETTARRTRPAARRARGPARCVRAERRLQPGRCRIRRNRGDRTSPARATRGAVRTRIMIYQRIVIATDFSDASIGAAKWASEQLAPDGELILVHAVELPHRPLFARDALPPNDVINQAVLDFA